MTDPKTQELVDAVKKLVADHPLKWDQVEGKRSVMYIPFSPEEDKVEAAKMRQAPFRAEVERDCDSQMLRTFGKGVQYMTQRTMENQVVTADNVMDLFNELDKSDQRIILDEVVRRMPVIVQHGEGQDVKALGLRAEDSVNVTGHGDKRKESITTEVGPEPVRLNADEVLQRMRQDLMTEGLGNEVQTLKLHCCGSGGKLGAAFEEAATVQKMNLLMYAYDNDSVGYRAPESALNNLRSHDRFVTSDANESLVKDLGELTKNLDQMIEHTVEEGWAVKDLEQVARAAQEAAAQAQQELSGLVQQEAGGEDQAFQMAKQTADYTATDVKLVGEIKARLDTLIQKMDKEVKVMEKEFKVTKGNYDSFALDGEVNPLEDAFQTESALLERQKDQLARIKEAAQKPLAEMVKDLKMLRWERHEQSLESAHINRQPRTVGEVLRAEKDRSLAGEGQELPVNAAGRAPWKTK